MYNDDTTVRILELMGKRAKEQALAELETIVAHWLARQFDQRLVEPNSGLGGANPFDYLTELERHADELASAPQDWMPWNYRRTLDARTPPPAPAR